MLSHKGILLYVTYNLPRTVYINKSIFTKRKKTTHSEISTNDNMFTF